MAMSKSGATITNERSVQKTIRYPTTSLKTLDHCQKITKRHKGREIASVDALTAAGPLRVVPRSLESDAEGPHQADALSTRPLEELKESSYN